MEKQQSLEKFNIYYSQLNVEQKRAVDTIEGPVMVIAGPGTGKTQILTLRIANILKQADVEPENILALTFTESGVASMRKRLAEIIGTPAYSVDLTTFHSFCNDIIQNYPEEFPDIIGAKSISDIDQITLLQEIINEARLDLLRPYGDPYFYLRAILSAINDLKKEGITPERFIELMTQEDQQFNLIDDLYHEKGAHKGKMKGAYTTLKKHIDKNKEISILYSAYQDALHKKRFYDFNDMILKVLECLKSNADLLLSLQEKHQYVLVDEHQDTNNAQNKILELLVNFHDDPNLFVVGDEKQAIFRFQGASLENFLYFKNLYPRAKLINLQHNYRSTQTILNAAENILPSREPLVANAKHPDVNIRLGEFSTPDSEFNFLAKDITSKINSGATPNSIAILYRDNKDALPLADALERTGIAFNIESDQELLNDENIKKLLALLSAINFYGEAEYIYPVLHLDFLEISALDIFKIAQYSRSHKNNPYEVIGDLGLLKEAGVKSQDKIIKLSQQLTQWQVIAHNSSVTQLFSDLFRDSGFLEYTLRQPHFLKTLQKTQALFSYLRDAIAEDKEYDLKRFLESISLAKEHGLGFRFKAGSLGHGVRLMTAHKSKGLEFDYVYIVHAFDGHWGNKRRRSLIHLPNSVTQLTDDKQQAKEESNDDERNLFYVALTRAKKEVTISYTQTNYQGRQQLSAQFIQEIDPNLIKHEDVSLYETEIAEHPEVIFKKPANHIDLLAIKDFVAQTFAKQGLSVTGLNNYLTCPWRYFYETLLTIPRAPHSLQLYGIAVHEAFKHFFDMLQEDSTIGLDFLLSGFQKALEKQPLQPIEFQDALNRGTKTLTGYYKTYKNTWPINALTEFSIKGIELAPDIRLRGMIDKIEPITKEKVFDLQSYYGPVNVIDYKTTKPKSRNVIEGATKDSDGNYKRQLVFYNILLNHYHDGQYQMARGEIDFIEPDDKGRYKKELFTISKEEIEELEEIIKKSLQK